MCGICGIIGEQKNEFRKEQLRGMMGAIRHRGPDDTGEYYDGKAALGFCRLSIVDLEFGAQPMKNETGNMILIFNGEIYNYPELRKELEKAGHIFSTNCDSEVLLHGYEQWGEKLPEYLRGMFAFVIWDVKKEELFIARDFFGIKPLYYSLFDGKFIFASEIKGILKYPGMKKQLNEEALEQYLSFQYSVMEETFFKGIYRVQPGTWMKCRVGSSILESYQYFQPALKPRKKSEKSEQQWITEVEKALKESVKVHEQADVEIGTFLSGGVDSGLGAKLFTGKRAYTVGFGPENSCYNEISKARETASQCNLRHTGLQVKEEEFWEIVPEVLYYMDEPTGDASAVALYFLAQSAALEVKAVISGEGADELFGGYRIYCEPESLRSYQKLPNSFRRAIMRFAGYLPDIRGKSFLIRGGRSVEERFIGNANIFSCEERKKILKNPTKAVSPAEFLKRDYERTKGMRDADRMQEIDLRYWLPGDILQKADRMSMAHSLEVRVPFLDKKLFDLVRELPGEYKQQKHRTKLLLRRVAARNLDIKTSERTKLGFPIPIRVWLREETGYMRVKRVFEDKTAGKFFYQEQLLRLLEEHRKGEKDNSRKIWTVYIFCVWYEIYF